MIESPLIFSATDVATAWRGVDFGHTPIASFDDVQDESVVAECHIPPFVSTMRINVSHKSGSKNGADVRMKVSSLLTDEKDKAI